MSNVINLKAKGLYTFANYLSSIPEGSLLDATNVVIDRDGIVEPRRGIKGYGNIGTSLDRAKQLLNYKDKVLAHYGSTLTYDNGSGTFTSFGSTFSSVDPLVRIKGVEQNGNFYVTTASGIKKIAASSTNLSTATVSDAGGVKALDGQATVNYDNPGFFLGFSKVAYRIVWGTKDVNSNLILGDPSSRIVVTNFSTSSGTIDLTFQVPQDITTDYFYQIYRTAQTTATPQTLDILESLDPGDEMKLVLENGVTSSDILTKSITINEIAPESFQQVGTNLYTNPVSGDGILQSNDRPPVSKDIASFKQCVFYANTQTREILSLSLLGLGGMASGNISNVTATNPAVITSTAHGLSSGNKVAIVGTGASAIDNAAYLTVTVIDANTFSVPVDGTGASPTTGSWYSSYLTVTDGTNTNLYFFVGRPEINQVTFDTKANTTDGSYFKIYAANDEVQYAIWFDKTGSTTAPTTPGFVQIKVDLQSTNSASDVANATLLAVETATNDFLISQASNVLTFTNANSGPSIDATPEKYIFTVSSANASAGSIYTNNSQTFTVLSTITGGTILTCSGTANPLTSGTLTKISGTGDPTITFSSFTTSVGGNFSIVTTQQGFGEDASKNHVRLSTYISTGEQIDDTARSLIRVINENNSEIIYGYYVSGTDDVPGLMDFERRTLVQTAFTMTANNSTVGALFNPDLTTPATSSNETSLNRIYFSKFQQPEAVPLVNYLDLGPKDKQIYRIIPLRDSLFVLKEEAIYRITGDSPSNFSATLFDSSSKLIAPDTCAVLNNQIFCLTSDGVATVTETGVGVISRPIEDVFRKLTNETFPNFFSASFGISYNSEHAYFIWTVSSSGDTYATQGFRYNTFTQTWTRWATSQTCGIVIPQTNKLYFGSATENLVEVERKTFTRKDYADHQFASAIPANAVNGTTIQIASTSNISVGDAFVQTQYVTIEQYNTLLLKLDLDPRVGLMPGTFDTNYFATLQFMVGDNLTNKMNDLVTKLNSDPGTSHGYTFSGATDFATIQTQYNLIITALNSDPLLKFANYQTSVGTIDMEFSVDSLSINAKTVTSATIPPLMVGPTVVYKSIPVSVIWAPSSMGDPSMLKHVRESTMLFEDTAFRGGLVAYDTDLSPSFEEIEFTMDGNGSWGGFAWGSNVWGGAGSNVPFRTYLPRQKQRCRFIRARFKHHDAFYKFSVLGLSYVYEVSSERAYRGK